MRIKLCYKEYDIKLSLNSIKEFKKNTDLDLWSILIEFIEEFNFSKDEPVLTRMRRLYSICDFETGSYILYSLMNTKDQKVSLDEIQDAMFRVGWMINNSNNDLSNPWCLVVVDAAYKIDKDFEQIIDLKKKADS